MKNTIKIKFRMSESEEIERILEVVQQQYDNEFEFRMGESSATISFDFDEENAQELEQELNKQLANTSAVVN